MRKFLLLLVRSRRKELIMVVCTIFLVFLGFILLDSLFRTAFETVGKEAKPFFGGDIRIESPSTITKDQKTRIAELAENLGFEYTERTAFYTTLADSEGGVGLVRILAVSPTYPLYGTFRYETLQEKPFRVLANEESYRRFSSWGVLKIGALQTEITGILREYPETSLAFGDEWNIIIMSAELLAGTKLSDIGSRIDYDILIKTRSELDIAPVISALREDRLLNGKKIEAYTEDAGRVESILRELGDYIRIVLISVVLIAGLWLFFVFDAYFSHLQKDVALFRILGITKVRAIFIISCFFLMLLGLTGIVSILAAYGISRIFSEIAVLGSFQIFRESVFIALLSGTFLFLFSFFIPLTSLLRSPPLAWLAPSAFWALRFWQLIQVTLSIALLSVLLYRTLVGTWGEALVFTSLLLGAITLIVLGIRTFLIGFFRFFAKRFEKRNFALFDALRTNIRPGSRSILVMTASILSVVALYTFLVISLHFLDRFDLGGRQDTNIYVLNILEKEAPAIRQAFGSEGLYSVLRARILSVNGQKISEHLRLDEPSREFSREFNLTTSSLDESPILSGKMDIGAWEVSVDAEFAQRLDLELGDILEFQLAGKSFELTVAALRGSDTTGTNPFFYFQVDENAFSKAPKNYFLARYVQDLESFKKEIYSLTWPHISFVDVEKILQEIANIAEKVVAMIIVFLVYVAIFVALLLVAASYSSKNLQSYRENLYKRLGAERSFIRKNHFYAVSSPLLFSGLIGSLLAPAIAFFALQQMPFLKIHLEIFFVSLSGIFLLVFLMLLTLKIKK